MADSSISKFFEKSLKERLDVVADFSGLSQDELKIIEDATGGISYNQADNMIENAIGTFSLPLGIATNFRINDKDYLIPMVIEEPSVIAAASKAAKIARIHGGFKAKSEQSYSIGQIQIVNVDVQSAIPKVIGASTEILNLANSKSNTLPKMGKGAKEVSCKDIQTDSGNMLIVELLIDVGDAMGANVTNTMCEAVAPMIEELTGGKVLLRILSNYSTNPSILQQYDKVIMLHNEYVTRAMFDAITNHPNVIYLYPNALYAEIEVDYIDETITLIRGHNYPEPEITNGFDWKFDNTHPYEYDKICANMEFYKIENGWMTNCYPENFFLEEHIGLFNLLKTIKDL